MLSPIFILLLVCLFLAVEKYQKAKRIRLHKERKIINLTRDFFWSYFFRLDQELKDKKADRSNPWFLNVSDALKENDKEKIRIRLEEIKMIKDNFSEFHQTESLFIES